MPKARLIFDGDWVYTEKEARIHKLTQETENKIDNIPGIVNDVNSTSTTDALSANMGKYLQDQINNISWTTIFLSTWDCTTGLPETDPAVDPYTYKTWNYYIVWKVAASGWTNYRPHWATYTHWVPSTSVETNEINVNDWYIYDWQTWVIQPASTVAIVIDDMLKPNSTNAVENRAIYSAVSQKQDRILDLATIREWAALWATSIQPWDNITELTNNVGYQTAGDVAVAIDEAIEWSKYVWPTAPSNPTEGMLWYDTTNDQLKVYDWAQWNVTWKEYNAWRGISIGDVSDYSAMRWPCPEGLHIPIYTEWIAVKTVWTTLWGWDSDWTNFGIALKLPFAGCRGSESVDIYGQGSYGAYWSSSRSDADSAYYLAFRSTGFNPQSNNDRAYSFSVRCFKDSPVVPTSSWTKLYWISIEAGGIFWSSDLWLISLSSNWTTWITIADKNLWATTVWNNWDTLSEANCGKYFQRWNNYWFPRTWTITNTSWDMVDASDNWPWNYYSSDTFITRNESPYRWDSSDNGNLWWWVTWAVQLNNAITNTGVLSVNGQTWDVNWLATTSYVDTAIDEATEWSKYIWPTAPSNPTEGMLWYDTTNDVLKVYNWTSWDVVDINLKWNVNTKTFEINLTSSSSTQPELLAKAQEIYNWLLQWNMAIIRNTFSDSTYIYLRDLGWDWPQFFAVEPTSTITSNSYSTIKRESIVFHIESWTVTSVFTRDLHKENYLATNRDYSSSYTPQYNGSPATKKYVDDTVSSATTWSKYVWPTAPSNPTEGMLWYDTTNDILKSYDWTSWDVVWNGDMAYSDFNFQSKSWATITLDLSTSISPSANFTINAPSSIKDWQRYILRVTSWATAYTMTLWTNITNPYSEDLTLTPNGIDQFLFLAVGWNLELQPDVYKVLWQIEVLLANI